MTTPDDHDIDAVVAALARIRGRRGPHGGHHGPKGAHHGEPHAHAMGAAVGALAMRGGGPARFRMLEALLGATEALSISDIADAVGVDQPRASRLVQQSVELDLVRREVDPHDARRSRVALTDHGRALAGRVRGQRATAVRAAMGELTDAERTDFVRLLTKFAAGWPTHE